MKKIPLNITSGLSSISKRIFSGGKKEELSEIVYGGYHNIRRYWEKLQECERYYAKAEPEWFKENWKHTVLIWFGIDDGIIQHQCPNSSDDLSSKNGYFAFISLLAAAKNLELEKGAKKTKSILEDNKFIKLQDDAEKFYEYSRSFEGLYDELWNVVYSEVPSELQLRVDILMEWEQRIKDTQSKRLLGVFKKSVMIWFEGFESIDEISSLEEDRNLAQNVYFALICWLNRLLAFGVRRDDTKEFIINDMDVTLQYKIKGSFKIGDTLKVKEPCFICRCNGLQTIVVKRGFANIIGAEEINTSMEYLESKENLISEPFHE